MRLGCCSLLLLSLILAKVAGLANPLVVKVCQNKDCCQRYSGKANNLVETMRHITSYNPSKECAIEIESSGCLSQCGKGPNVQVSEELFHDVKNVHSAAAVLEMASGSSFGAHPTLIAAVKVMERAKLASTWDEKEKFLTSVISALEKKPELAKGTVQGHAHAVRAQQRLEAERYELAKEDAIVATQLDPKHPKAWRILADICEATNDIPGAMEALSKWAETNPTYRSKVTKELDRLLDLESTQQQV